MTNKQDKIEYLHDLYWHSVSDRTKEIITLLLMANVLFPAVCGGLWLIFMFFHNLCN